MISQNYPAYIEVLEQQVVPPGRVYVPEEGEPPQPPSVIMNQLQGSNLGADLYNGTIL